MADFEDSCSPTWKNVDRGPEEPDRRDRGHDRARRRPRREGLPPEPAHRRRSWCGPRGWHLEEKHVLVDGEPVSASLFDFGLFFFHNARRLLARGTAPYFYLPKMESHLEARLWNDVFRAAQEELGIPIGTIRATVLIETILAAFEMDEILWELRDHSAGPELRAVGLHLQLHQEIPEPPRLRAARPLARDDDPPLPAVATRTSSIRTCHRRGIHAMGGMAAQIPIKGDEASERPRHGEGRRGQAARGRGRARRDLGRASGPRAAGARDLRRRDARAEPDRAACSRPKRSRRTTCSRFPRAPITEAGLRQNVNVGDPLPRGVAARLGLRPALQPHGRRGDGRDLAHAGLAVAPARRAARGRPDDHAGPLCRRPRRGARRHPAPGRRGRLARRPLRARRRDLRRARDFRDASRIS